MFCNNSGCACDGSDAVIWKTVVEAYQRNRNSFG